MVGMLKNGTSEIEPSPKSTLLADAIVILIFETESDFDRSSLIGREFFTQFISANLGSLVSQGLLHGEQKVKYYGNIESPLSLIVSGPKESLYRLTEAWRNRLLKSPNGTRLLSYGLVDNFRMDSIVQRQTIKLADLVLMAIADLNNMKLLAQSSTIKQHLESKCEEMNIPQLNAIEHCISELVKTKKIYFYSYGGSYKLQMNAIPHINSNVPPSIQIQSTPTSKTPKQVKRKTFAFDLTKKIKNSIRRKTLSPVTHTTTEARAPSVVNYSLPSTKSINPSMTSTASQVTTPNFSESFHSDNTSNDSPLRLQKRLSPEHETNGALNTRCTEADGVSFVRATGKVIKRKSSRRHPNSYSPRDRTDNVRPENATPTAPKRKSKQLVSNNNNIDVWSSNLRRLPKPVHANSSQSNPEDDQEVNAILNKERRFIKSEGFAFPSPPPVAHGVKCASEDSIFDQESEGVDDVLPPTPVARKQSSSITLNLKRAGMSDNLTFEQVGSPPAHRRDYIPDSKEYQSTSRSKTPLSIHEMKGRLKSHFEQRQNQRPKSCHPVFISPIQHQKGTTQSPNDTKDVRYGNMWNKPRSHSPISPKYKGPTIIKANFTPPLSPTLLTNYTDRQNKLSVSRQEHRKSDIIERPKSVNPDKLFRQSPSTPIPKRGLNKQLSLDVLEQLSLTREEWIEYFNSRKTPVRLKNEIERLSPTKTK